MKLVVVAKARARLMRVIDARPRVSTGFKQFVCQVNYTGVPKPPGTICLNVRHVISIIPTPSYCNIDKILNVHPCHNPENRNSR